MKKNKILLWDFDGTLGHRPGMWSKALIDVLVEQQPKCAITVEDIRPFLRKGFPWHQSHIPHPHITTSEAWWAEIEPLLARAYVGIGCSFAQAEQLAVLAHEKYIDTHGWRLYDDVITTLELLKQQGWQHAILSNHVPELSTIVDALGLTPYMKSIFSSALLGYEKPHPQFFRSALAALGNPQTVWMIGDNIEADILGAEAAGIPAILVRKQDVRVKYSSLTLLPIASILSGIS